MEFMISSDIQQPEIVLPSANRLINSLRSMGYEFEKAVADIIDNSIEAGATTVCVDVVFKGLDSYIAILDDGKGMSSDELVEAMRFGTNRDYEIGDLGKFGLGLKTASISQCRRLIVASRKNLHEPTVIKCWDLDYIAQTNDWTLLTLSRNDLPKETVDLLETGTGTIVIWEKLDKTMEYNPPDSKYAQNGFGKLCEKLEQHLSMVFHRFLSKEAKRKIPFSILLNENTISPWDPFVRNERDTLPMPEVPLVLYIEDKENKIRLQPFILPHQKRFSSAAAHERASGPKKWNWQQGFYIYREDRMIQSGGWCHLRASDEHNKLARIALDFSSDSDAAFRLNVAKTSVTLPAELREKIKQGISEAIKMAEQRYRSEGESLLNSKKLGKSKMATARANPEKNIASPAKHEYTPFLNEKNKEKGHGNSLQPLSGVSSKGIDSNLYPKNGRTEVDKSSFQFQKNSPVASLEEPDEVFIREGTSDCAEVPEDLLRKVTSLNQEEMINFVEIMFQVIALEPDAEKFYRIIEKSIR